ncbi:hypothetical protein AusDCA_3516 [Desulfitobacterium sp. AusDCA]
MEKQQIAKNLLLFARKKLKPYGLSAFLLLSA